MREDKAIKAGGTAPTINLGAIVRHNEGYAVLLGHVDEADPKPDRLAWAAHGPELRPLLLQAKKVESRVLHVFTNGLHNRQWDSVRAHLSPWMQASFEEKHLVDLETLRASPAVPSVLHPSPTAGFPPALRSAAWRVYMSAIRVMCSDLAQERVRVYLKAREEHQAPKDEVFREANADEYALTALLNLKDVRVLPGDVLQLTRAGRS
jgi:hypothetical protein